MFEKVLITDEERQMFPKWTVLDEDLADVDPVLAEQVLESRLEFFRGDISRTDYWHDPEGIDVIADIQYVDDGTRAHRERDGSLWKTRQIPAWQGSCRSCG